ncbi:MAG: LLM class flavin-dependent oxidoreductase [Nitrososphaerota archaeon]|nr:LLM class flavin-dependent oxidoreductase [Nitrososphaerota archaeon]MDG6962869.1 LLM class flavin-dependent oxidoreductase [Nitrososphaerota archaeon]MDG6980770.1 LLM class flavin-dependent oxidoreductase [Nitrososphaerota archaeon]MDG7032626.1 LLM class flavin-dependent oxidoreductase [Nitrososphaerota archaeon]
MKFGVVVPSGWSADKILDAGMAAQMLELDFFLVTDHYITPTTDSSVDAWSILAALAAKTDRMTIGTCVTPIPFRPPQMLAKMVATVDQVSRGRVVLGVGAGWSRAEFDAYGKWEDDRTRMAMTVEGLELMLKLWASEEPFDFQGRYYTSKGAILRPKPVARPHPPLWFGGTGRRMLKRVAAKYADAWLPPVPGLPDGEYRRVFEALRGGEERRDAPVKVMFNGTFPEIEGRIEKFAGMGCEAAMLVRTPYEELPSAMLELSEMAQSYGKKEG